MSEGSIKDIMALAEAISSRRATDERFGDLLAEMSAALADVTEALGADKTPAQPAIDADALGHAIATALLAGIKQLPKPSIQMPEISLPAAPQNPWRRLEIGLNRSASGSVESLTLLRKD